MTCFFLSVFVSGVEYLRDVDFLILVVELQDPDGGNNADEKQKDGRRKPARQPKNLHQHNFKKMEIHTSMLSSKVTHQELF